MTLKCEALTKGEQDTAWIRNQAGIAQAIDLYFFLYRVSDKRQNTASHSLDGFISTFGFSFVLCAVPRNLKPFSGNHEPQGRGRACHLLIDVEVAGIRLRGGT
jgi:hypothetical protein